MQKEEKKLSTIHLSLDAFLNNPGETDGTGLKKRIAIRQVFPPPDKDQWEEVLQKGN